MAYNTAFLYESSTKNCVVVEEKHGTIAIAKGLHSNLLPLAEVKSYVQNFAS